MVSRSTVSNASFRSRKTTALTLPRSILKAQLSVVSRRAVTVQCKERKLDVMCRNDIFIAQKIVQLVINNPFENFSYTDENDRKIGR